jgi:hypothetical protein
VLRAQSSCGAADRIAEVIGDRLLEVGSVQSRADM